MLSNEWLEAMEGVEGDDQSGWVDADSVVERGQIGCTELDLVAFQQVGRHKDELFLNGKSGKNFKMR